MVVDRLQSKVARRLGRGLAGAAAGLILALMLGGCAAFGNVGNPNDAHLSFPPGNLVAQHNSALNLKVLPKAPANPDYQVIIYHNTNTVGEFVPEQLTVPVGSTVEWIWTDQLDQHNVWWTDQNLPNSPTKGAGYRWAVQFLAPGTYDYYCTLHPGMLGTVVVTG